MAAFVDLVPLLDDNYVFMIRNSEDKNVILIDPGDADPCKVYIEKHNLDLNTLLITHHHPDHIEGIPKLKTEHPDLKIYAPEKNRLQIPWATKYLKDGDQISSGFFQFEVFELPGHTLGICGYFEPKQQWLFSGDVLFGLGCGRLFEGTAEMLFESLKKIKDLPAQTKVFCSHEYTMTNLRFVEMLIDENKIPAGFDHEHFNHYRGNIKSNHLEKKPTVPLYLKTELLCNPFLLASTAEELGELRRLRNHFR